MPESPDADGASSHGPLPNGTIATADAAGPPRDPTGDSDSGEDSGDDALDGEALERDETMTALMLLCEGALEEVAAVGDWYADSVRRADVYLAAAEDGDLDEVETLTEVRSGGLLRRSDSFSSAEEWVVAAILRRRTFKGQPCYLVQWRGHDAPSWEVEEDLVAQGYAGWLERFAEAAATRGRPPPPTRPPPLPPLTPSGAADHRPPPARPGEFSPERFWPDFKALISRAFRAANPTACISRIQNVVDPARARTFVGRWTRTGGGRGEVPVMLFHCTREATVPGIIANGLVVPGTSGGGVKVLNGSAYGVGIYTSRGQPFLNFCGGGHYAMVCAGLVGPTYVSAAMHNEIVVFFDPALVLPCFLVEYHLQDRCHHIPTYVSDMYSPSAPWPPPDPRPYAAHTILSADDSRRLTPWARASQPLDPGGAGGGGKDSDRWVAHARAAPITKRRLRQSARRVKALYRQGLLQQARTSR